MPSIQNFKAVGIVGFVDKALVRETVTRLAQFLVSKGISTWIESEAFLIEKVECVSFSTREEMGEKCDLVVVVGGDGSLLRAARDLAGMDTPILGVNRGRLGFLTDIAPTELEQRVSDVLNGDYVATHRFLLEVEIHREGEVVAKGLALNDIVLQPRGSIRMIQFSLRIDKQYVYTLRADGLIVSTPTGSTAYALAGGGPIIHPNLDAIDLVPINPHTLSNRPIIIHADSELELVVERDSVVDARVVCDGQEYIDAELGDRIKIRRKPGELRLLHPEEHDFYATCRTKLNWAND